MKLVHSHWLGCASIALLAACGGQSSDGGRDRWLHMDASAEAGVSTDGTGGTDNTDSTSTDTEVDGGSEPDDTDPDNTDPNNTDPDNTDPDDTDPTDPSFTDPDNTDPDNTDPDDTDPTDPSVTDPDDTDPTDPDDTDPTDTTDPDVSDTDVTDATDPTDTDVSDTDMTDVTDPTDTDMTDATDPTDTDVSDTDMTDGSDTDLPDDCTEWTSSDRNYCNYELNCPNEYAYSNCSKNGDLYDCYCSKNNIWRNYVIGGVTTIGACDTMMDLCDQNLEFNGPVACSSADSSSSFDCQVSERCGPTASLPGGVTVYNIRNNNYASCYQFDGGFPGPGIPGIPGQSGISCNCNVNGYSRNFSLAGTTLANACGYGYDVCEAGNSLQFGGPANCSDATSSESVNSCDIWQPCQREASLGDGVTASITIDRNVTCNSAGASWACSCNAGSTSAGFGIAPQPEPADTCASALDLCVDVEGVTPSGPIECSFHSRTTAPDSCGRVNTCGQTATVNGVQVRVNGYVNVNCWYFDEDEYSCDCSSGANWDSFMFPSAGTSRLTCDGAIVECQTRVNLQSGMSGSALMSSPSQLFTADESVEFE